MGCKSPPTKESKASGDDSKVLMSKAWVKNTDAIISEVLPLQAGDAAKTWILDYVLACPTVVLESDLKDIFHCTSC